VEQQEALLTSAATPRAELLLSAVEPIRRLIGLAK